MSHRFYYTAYIDVAAEINNPNIPAMSYSLRDIIKAGLEGLGMEKNQATVQLSNIEEILSDET